MADGVTTQQGYFSLLRWRPNAARDEARNVAVILIDGLGEWGQVTPAPLSSISSRLKDQGILDAALVGLQSKIQDDPKSFTLEYLKELHSSLRHSLVLSEPQRVAVTDLADTARALYRAYVAPRGGGTRKLTKGVVLDRVVNALRRRGIPVRRGAYVEDFIFDAVIDAPRQQRVLEVLSFAAARKDWTPIEREAGHFLFALTELPIAGTAVVQPPTAETGDAAAATFDRIQRWMEGADVPIISPEDATEPQLTLEALVGHE